MSQPTDRRKFLCQSVAGLGSLAFLPRLQPVGAEETKLDPKLVRLDSGIEPLVRLIEETPRNRLMEEIGVRIRKGLSYREALAALLLAGVRNIQPRPNVGFKFHAVLVVNSAHLASMDSPEQHRWLPILWALDNFKASQARNVEEGGWRMGPVNDARLPTARRSRKAFESAMDQWDVEAADAAVAAWVRTAGMNETFDVFARYGARDFRDIGHKAIFVANAFRTLQVVGWQHAEPVLRSLAYALLRHEGENPAQRDGEPDRSGRENLKRAASIREGWLEGKTHADTAAVILESIRSQSPAEVCDLAVGLLNKGVAPQSLWDGLLLAGGELLMRQPGIVGLHTLTTANAMRYKFSACGDDETRKLILLQCAAFLPQFLSAMKGRGKVGDERIEALEPASSKEVRSPEFVMNEVGRDRQAAAAKALGFLQAGENARTLIDLARINIFLKGTDSHDYKFSSAVLEDYEHVSRPHRDRFLAAGTYWLKGTSAKDNTLVGRIREALKG